MNSPEIERPAADAPPLDTLDELEELVLLNRLSPADLDRLLDPQRFQVWMQFLHPEQRKKVAEDYDHPVVLRGVPDTARVFAEEVFGPVVSANRFHSLDEAIDRVNASVYGLQASIFTKDLATAFRAARRVHVGGFLINDVPQFRADQMPYGGVKRSGTGREGPHYAIEEMTERKLICWNVS
jgi:acyl-CoA reductase-like NAD-dependent aldehyde dehydrogenase